MNSIVNDGLPVVQRLIAASADINMTHDGLVQFDLFSGGSCVATHKCTQAAVHVALRSPQPIDTLAVLVDLRADISATTTDGPPRVKECQFMTSLPTGGFE